MFRSISTNRVTEDDYQSIYNQSPKSKGVAPVLRALSLEANENSEYESSNLSEVTPKKLKAQTQFSQKAVHIIPLILLFCAFFLWIFSNPDIDLPIKNDISKLQVKGKTMERDDRTNSRGTDVVDMGLHKHDSHKLASTLANL
ncbi:hypothetical protein Ccrd_017061 [Cynara cardunculus var. scolymus]|uniref:Uncharacterized protein n=1 Tax=Cynara cardunculus var. scolymus TaxID=59895 RepID=A0A124SFX5_CYNCS|nr:hypothetical protein Ccrd_017061 [Cynara cardunculus var. scolymus]